MKSLFSGMCWRCWPTFCRCPLSDEEVEQMKGELFLLDKELRRENRRARELESALRGLADAIGKARTKRLESDGLDGIPTDLHDISVLAQESLTLLHEERNQDRLIGIAATPSTDASGAEVKL